MSKEGDSNSSFVIVLIVVGLLLLPGGIILGLGMASMGGGWQGGSTPPQPINVGPNSPVAGLLTDFKRFTKPADYLKQDGGPSLDQLSDRLNTIILAIDKNDPQYAGLGTKAKDVRALAADACTRIQAIKAAVLSRNTASANTAANQLFADMQKINDIANAGMSVGGTNDQIISQLYSASQSHFRCLISTAAQQGYDLKITEGMRSIDKQNEYYAQGRTKPGQIITYAKGGDSWHNYGLAVDVVDRKLGYNLTESRWAQLGGIGSGCGLVWGGTFTKLHDTPHFQYAGNPPLKLRDLKAGRRPQ